LKRGIAGGLQYWGGGHKVGWNLARPTWDLKTSGLEKGKKGMGFRGEKKERGMGTLIAVQIPE